MDSNQTIQLKPMYPHSHISLCNPPVISATIPGLSLSGPGSLSIVEATNGSNSAIQESNNPNTLQQSVTAHSKTTTQIIPVTTGSVCLNNIQLQMHPQAFSQGQLPIQSGRYLTNGQSKGNQMLQIHITTPMIHTASSLNGTLSTHTADDRKQLAINGTSLMSDSSSNGSSKSGASEMNQANVDALSSLVSSKGSTQRNNEYADLARASCSSSNSGVSMRLGSTDSSRVRGFKCQVCNRDFTQKGNLKTHMMTHSGERPYECQTCGKNFTQKGNLDTHVKIHTETKDHKCQYCDRGFTQRGNLKTHIRSIHTKEKPYACGHCGKAFSQKGNMLTHYRTHDKEARFPCNVCGKTFSQKGNLKTHQQRHSRSSTR